MTSEQDAITDEQKETVKEQFDGLTAAFQLDESPEEGNSPPVVLSNEVSSQ